MEAYALAKVCQKLGVRLISVKYITDGANDNGSFRLGRESALAHKKFYLSNVLSL